MVDAMLLQAIGQLVGAIHQQTTAQVAAAQAAQAAQAAPGCCPSSSSRPSTPHHCLALQRQCN